MTRKYSSIKDHGFWNPDATVTVTNNPIDLIKDLQIEIEDLESRLKESDEQNERYEKALEFYADDKNWKMYEIDDNHNVVMVIDDYEIHMGEDDLFVDEIIIGKRAREALKK